MKRLLLVEDNASNGKLMSAVLRQAGYAVDVARSADEAIPLALAENYDLILMDIQLPGTDGLAATRLLRTRPETARTPILAVTAHAMEGDADWILSAGCSAYISKPIAYRSLLSEVARLLGEGGGQT